MLVLTRISGIFIVSPFFGSKNIPVIIRVGVAVAISIVLFPLIALRPEMKIPETLIGYVIAVILELFIGWIIGFVAYIVISTIHIAGSLLDMQVGFAMINVLDPTTGQQVPLIGSFKYNLAIIVFLVTNSHHFLLTALFDSFQMVPLLAINFHPEIMRFFIDLVMTAMGTGLKIALPVLAAILLTDVGLGILARTMPQMNIFIVGIPAKIFVGLFILIFVLPFYILFLDVTFNEMYGNIYIVLRSLV